MALTAAERKQRSRALKKGLPDPIAARREAEGFHESWKVQQQQDQAFAATQDATGKFYRDECRSCVELLAIYEGAELVSKDLEESEDAAKKKKQLKIERPNPSITPIQIRAITRKQIVPGTEFEIELPIEPNEIEHKSLFEVNQIVPFQQWLDLRSKSRKNLFWLGRLLGKDLYHAIHQIVCDQFVTKNFEGMYYPGYTLGDFHLMIGAQKRYMADGVTPCREMMLLDARGFYKSTINGIDSVQWLLNCPDIRIMIITGENGLAVTFLQEIKSYFGMKEGSHPTAFNLLFPEYVITGIAVDSTKPLVCPARILKQKGKNLWVNSIVASLSGWHPDIKKGDDVVTDENSNTPETRAKLKKKYDGTKNTVGKYGFIDHIGTRYFLDDWYGSRLLPDKKTQKVFPIKYFCRGAWVVKAEYQNRRQYPLKALTPEMVILTAPQIADWDYLQSLLGDGEREFCNQQLNEPSDDVADSPWVNCFTEQALRAHSYPVESAPTNGTIFQFCDIAYGEKEGSDNTAIATIIIYQNKEGKWSICVRSLEYGKWKPSEIPDQVCLAYRGFPAAQKVYIEKCNGAEFLYQSIIPYTNKYTVPELRDKIVLFPIDNSSGAKRNRIKAIEGLMSEGRFHIVNGPWIDDLYSQFCKFTGERSTKYRKDDLPDVISFALRCLPTGSYNSGVDPEESEREMERLRIEAANNAGYQRMFGGTTLLPSLNLSEPPKEEPKVDPRRAMMNRILPPGMRT